MSDGSRGWSDWWSGDHAENFYRLLLNVMPSRHRRLFADEMLDVFRHQRSRECRGHAQRALQLLRTSFDLLATAMILHAENLLKQISPSQQNPRERFRRGLEKGDFMSSWVSDIRFGMRNLIRSPLLVMVAVLTLGAGIGANTAIFSVLNTVLLRPLPYENPESLVHIYESNPLKSWTQQTASPANFLDWREQSESFQDMAGYWSFDGATVEADGERERVSTGQATGNLFRLLGTRPSAGRLFQPSETFSGEAAVALISHSYWESRFGGRPEVVGSILQTSEGAREIVGVLPPGFRLPGIAVPPQLWTPSEWDPEVYGVAVWTRRAHWVTVVGRLKPNVSRQEASQELQTIAARLQEEYPETNEQAGVGIIGLQDWVAGEARTPLWLLMASVGVVLLIACINVANLLLARGRSRRREMAIRGALGAGRLRLLRQLLTEGLILVLGAGALGLALAYWGVAFLRSTAPDGIPRIGELSVDASVLLFALLCSAATLLIFASLPAWTLSRAPVVQGLSQGGRQGSGGGASPLGRGLVVAEVALSVLLVIGAGLLLRSFLHLQSEPTGFDASQVLSMRFNLEDAGYEEAQQALAFIDRAIPRLQALPQVQEAALATSIPIGGDGTWSGTVFIEGQATRVEEFRHRTVDPRYLPTLSVRLLEGRNFEPSDGPQSQPVALVNEALAAQFEDGRVIGRRISFAEDGPQMTVVGIVANEKYRQIRAQPTPQVYQPLVQRLRPDIHALLKTSGDPARLSSAAREALLDIEPRLVIFDVRPLPSYLRESLATDRFMAQMVGAFALLALLLAAVGLYSVLSYTVSRRRQEFGIRMALGARMSDILALVMRQGLAVSLLGVVLGLAAAWGVSRWIGGLLFNVSPTDPLTFAGVAGGLAAVALLACYRPARRAAKVDPQVTLRAE
ncbi:MAG TPA: ABC transporter permease [Acidobacteriota bacterium]|nr:ABC transporter permease [Acidobacteriota bacterium]